MRRLAPGLCFAASAFAATSGIPSGEYELAAQTVMPHLENMRNVTDHATACLRPEGLEALFPILNQPALRGCTLAWPKTTDRGTRYVLACASARVASGEASLSRDGAAVVGDLVVKMGGKNMTFSQHVRAERRGDCAPP